MVEIHSGAIISVYLEQWGIATIKFSFHLDFKLS